MTVRILVTVERLREVLYYDPDLGWFMWLTDRRRTRAGACAGGLHSDGYIGIKIDGLEYPAHRLAWLYMTGEWPLNLIDHRDTNRSNNTWTNIRPATRSINEQNQRRAHRDSTSGLLGAHRNGKRWRAAITVDGISRHIGRFETAELAHAAYVEAKRRLHPGGTL